MEKKLMKRWMILLSGLILSCSATMPVMAEPVEADPIAAMISEMSLEKKVGQLFLVRPDALDFSIALDDVKSARSAGVTGMTADIEEALSAIPVGGIAIFGKNIESAEQCQALIQAFQQASSIPLLVAVDEEGGLVARLANNSAFDLPQYESAAAVGSSGNPEDAYSMGNVIGQYLHEYSFNLDFAPVADVNTNPQNPVIGTRAFSSDPETAAAMVGAAVRGFHDGGVACTLKHFPGHGDTDADSHNGAVYTYKTWEEIQATEMLPFQAGIASGADLIMTAHINTPNATDDELPASLSHEWITNRLRGELGFQGVVVTDSLSMDAIMDEYSSGEAAIMALNAGVDLLLMPYDLQDAYNSVLAAVQNGTLSEENIDESLYRILSLKETRGLL